MTAFTLDPVADLRELLRFPFMVHALTAGTLVAVLGATVGWYVVLRHQSFVAHTLAVMAFPGAAGAALVGLPATLGLYLAAGAGAAALGVRRGGSPAANARSGAAVGTVQSVGLAAGLLFLSLNAALLSGPETLLFGTFLGVTRGQVVVLALVTLVALSLLAAIGRPLLLASVDPELARARGVPVSALELGFLGLVALAVAAASQITGALLVFALLVAPAGAARALTVRPLPGLLLSVGVALLVVWLALAGAYFSPLPLGFWVTSLASTAFLLARLLGRWRRRR